MPKKKCSGYSFFVAIIASIGGLLFGYNTTVISGALLFLAKDFNLSVFQQQLIVSILLIGALLGAFVGGMVSDKLGRRYSLFLSVLFFILGVFFLVVSETLAHLLIGRTIVAFGIGIASLAVPLYIAEMSHPHIRGCLVSLNQLAVTIGILLSYLVGFSFSHTGDWKSMFSFAFYPSFIMLIGLLFIPETPSFLASRGKIKKAEKILAKIHRAKKDEEVFVETAKESPKELVKWSNFFDRALFPALVIGVVMSLIQQITGINAVIYYAPTIFQYAGFGSASSALLASVGIGLINVIMTIVALWLVDRVGRRPLLLIGVLGMVLSLLVLGFSFIFAKTLYVTATLSLMFYVAFFAIGLGPIVWILISEIFPMGIRGRAMGVAIFVNWLGNWAVSFTFLTLIQFLGKGGAFLLYAFIGLLALWFIYRKVPETKGQTLEAIQRFWRKGKKLEK